MREARARRGSLRKPRRPTPDLPSFGLAHVPRPRPSSFHSCAPICETYNTRAREHVGSYVWWRRLLAEVRVARPFSNFCHESSVPRGTRQRGPLLGKRPLSLLPSAALSPPSAYVCGEVPRESVARISEKVCGSTSAPRITAEPGLSKFY